VAARTNEKRVGGFDDDKIVNADGGDEFGRAVEEIAGSVECVARASENIFGRFLARSS